VLVLGVACGQADGDEELWDDTGVSDVTMGPHTITSPTSTTTVPQYHIPKPGNFPHNSCSDTEPNDHPNDAVKCGILNENFDGLSGVYLWDGHIGGNDTDDWYVFETGPTVTGLYQLAEWFAMEENLLDFAIYQVKGDGAELVEVMVAESDDPWGEHPLWEDMLVKPGKVYALHVYSVSGIGDYGL
jgi:hypothetical protein